MLKRSINHTLLNGSCGSLNPRMCKQNYEYELCRECILQLIFRFPEPSYYCHTYFPLCMYAVILIGEHKPFDSNVKNAASQTGKLTCFIVLLQVKNSFLVYKFWFNTAKFGTTRGLIFMLINFMSNLSKIFAK